MFYVDFAIREVEIALPGEQSYFFEELADSVATTLMLLAAVLVFRDLRQARTAGSLPLPSPQAPRPGATWFRSAIPIPRDRPFRFGIDQ